MNQVEPNSEFASKNREILRDLSILQGVWYGCFYVILRSTPGSGKRPWPTVDFLSEEALSAVTVVMGFVVVVMAIAYFWMYSEFVKGLPSAIADPTEQLTRQRMFRRAWPPGSGRRKLVPFLCIAVLFELFIWLRGAL